MDIADISLVQADSAKALAAGASGATKDSEQVQAATEQFEAILIRQYLNDAMKPLFDGPLMGNGSGTHMYQYMITDTLANELSQTSTFGMASLLNMQLTSPELRHDHD
jgi:Rod binding domain-containing protein